MCASCDTGINKSDVVADFRAAKVMEDINRALEHIDDTDMIELCENVLGKLVKISDEEFALLDFMATE